MMTVVCTKDDSHDLFRLMICNPSPLYLFAIPTGTPLLWCCYRRQGVLAKLLLHNYSANITVRANSGDTPLTASASVGSAGLIQLLMVTARQRLENAENALLAGSEEAEEGKGAVAAAAGIGNLKAFVDAQNTSGYSALLWAADRGHVKAAAALLEGGASLSLMGRVEVEISAEEALFGIHEERGGLKGVRAFFFLLSSLQKNLSAHTSNF